MSETRFDDKLRAHYDGRTMTEERLSLLAALAPDATAPRPARTRGVFLASGGLSRAAAVVLFIVAGALAMQWNTERRAADGLSDELADARARNLQLEQRLREGSPFADADSPRFVAVRIASTPCPGCRKTREQFDKLLEQHASDDVVFVTFDVTSPAGRKQAEHLACNLGLRWAAGDCRKCCAIQLFDRRQKQLVATQYALNSTDEFERVLDEALAKPGG